MNHVLAHLYAQLCPQPAPEPAAPPPTPDPAHHRAMAYDRDYIATHAAHFHHHPDLVTYDRRPLLNEWRDLLPSGAFVRVFVINERTTVRVLHTAMGQRIGEPVIDTWLGDEAASVTPEVMAS